MNKISMREAEQIARLMSKRNIVLGKISYLEMNQTASTYQKTIIESIEAELKKLGVNLDE